jgi:hypothetical protein
MYRLALEQQKNVLADTGTTEECTGRHWNNRRMYRPTLEQQKNVPADNGTMNIAQRQLEEPSPVRKRKKSPLKFRIVINAFLKINR